MTWQRRGLQIFAMLIVETAIPTDPGPRALLEQSHAMMRALFEVNYFLSLDELAAPDVHFVTARQGGEVLGTGALKRMDGYGEVKSMFTGEAARGRGVGAAILRALEDQACAEGIAVLKLETGEELAAAIRLYERHGFTRCGPFGDYGHNGVSVYMEKPLQLPG